jgi:hypothetical protein
MTLARHRRAISLLTSLKNQTPLHHMNLHRGIDRKSGPVQPLANTATVAVPER